MTLTGLEFISIGFPNSDFFFFHNEESLQVGELVTLGTRERAFFFFFSFFFFLNVEFL